MKQFTVLLISIFVIIHVQAKTPSECHSDLKEMCKDKQGKEKFECMKSSTDKMDDECKKMLEAGKQKFMPGKGHPCMADREKCKDAGGGHEKVMKCLFEKRAELSDSCKKHLDEKLKENPCMEDHMKFCGDVKPGEGRIIECMKKNSASLSAACKEKVEKSKKEDFDKGI